MLKAGAEYCFSTVSITTAINLRADHKNSGKYERSETTDANKIRRKIITKII